MIIDTGPAILLRLYQDLWKFEKVLDFQLETSFKQPVIGVDEVGRGPLAGPVVSCACIFFDYSLSIEELKEINDSKKLSFQKRQKAFKLILKMKKENKLDFGIGLASVKEIDKVNILNATILSMKRAVQKLKILHGTIIVDGNIKFNIEKLSCKNFIKGDQISLSIASASIIAKVYRDRYMVKIGRDYPYFKWHKNAGYGTIEHRHQIQLRGITQHHRKSFKPIKTFIQNNDSTC